MITIFATILCTWRLVDIYQGGSYFDSLGKEGSLILFLVLVILNTSFLWDSLKRDYKIFKEFIKIIKNKNTEG